MIPTSRRELMQALGLGGAVAAAGCTAGSNLEATEMDRGLEQAERRAVEQVAADPTDVPEPIDRDEPTHHEIALSVREVTAPIEEGKTFNFLTYEGRVPGPMVRVRQGDTVSFSMENPPESKMAHNVDFHAVYGTGGGSVATTAAPGEANGMRFTAEYPGAFIYHCAVPRLDYHISAGMFGMIVVEPPAGFPEVDRELYFGQHEVYTDGADGHQSFDPEAMKREDPNYVVFNGEANAFAASKHGPIAVEQGETVRVFLVDGGPNLSSNFHAVADRRGRDEVEVQVGARGNGGRYAFDPAAVHVDPGTTVVWRWVDDGGVHDVVEAEDAYGSRTMAGEDVTFAVQFDGNGVSRYACGPHEDRGMRGVVLVGYGERERTTPLGFALIAGLGGATVLALLRMMADAAPGGREPRTARGP